MNYFLKTNTEAELWTALESAGIVQKVYDPTDELNVRPPLDITDPNPNAWAPSGKYTRVLGREYSLDVVGTIYKETGNKITTFDGFEVPEKVAIEGFHANLKVTGIEMTEERLSQLSSLPIIEAPTTPYRVWAGE